MDFIVLLMTQLALDHLKLRALLRAQALLLGATLFFFLLPDAPPLLRLPVYPAAAYLLLGGGRPLRILEGALGILCGYAAAAGFCSLAGAGWASLLMGLFVFGLLLRRRRHLKNRWNIEVTLCKNGLSRSFPALIDTGNRLREHRSGAPVLIAEEAALGEILCGVDPAECRTLPYGVLGSSGEILCFRPDALAFRAGGPLLRAPDCWVAVFPGRIPGRIRALAPPEFSESIRVAPDSLLAVQGTIRRFYHGVFKRKTIHLWSGRADSAGLGVLYRRERSASPAADPGGGGSAGAQGTRRR